MEDNFNLKQFLTENKLTSVARLSEAEDGTYSISFHSNKGGYRRHDGLSKKEAKYYYLKYVKYGDVDITYKDNYHDFPQEVSPSYLLKTEELDEANTNIDMDSIKDRIEKWIENNNLGDKLDVIKDPYSPVLFIKFRSNYLAWVSFKPISSRTLEVNAAYGRKPKNANVNHLEDWLDNYFKNLFPQNFQDRINDWKEKFKERYSYIAVADDVLEDCIKKVLDMSGVKSEAFILDHVKDYILSQDLADEVIDEAKEETDEE